MTRKTFLTLVSLIGSAVGLFALTSPALLLQSKGVIPNDAAKLWVQEVGLLLMALGLIGWMVRGHRDSPTLNAILLGNIFVQAGLFPIELIAYSNGLITKPSGVVPNSVLHLVLAGGFSWFLFKARSAPKT